MNDKTTQQGKLFHAGSEFTPVVGQAPAACSDTLWALPGPTTSPTLVHPSELASRMLTSSALAPIPRISHQTQVCVWFALDSRSPQDLGAPSHSLLYPLTAHNPVSQPASRATLKGLVGFCCTLTLLFIDHLPCTSPGLGSLHTLSHCSSHKKTVK